MLSVQPEEVDADLLLSVESVLSSWLNMGQLATVFWCLSSLKLSKWLNFSFTNSRALLPTIHTNCPDWSHFAQNLTRGVSFCPEYHTQSLFFTQPAHTPFGDIDLHKTPQSPPQNTPFPVLNLKVGKMGDLDPSHPTRQNVWKVENFSSSGQKKIIHTIQGSWCPHPF